MVFATSKGSDQPAHYAQSDQSLSKSLEYFMFVKLLTEYNLEFLSLKGGCTCLSESIYMLKCHIVENHMSRLICCGHPKHMFKLMGEKTFTNLNLKILFWVYDRTYFSGMFNLKKTSRKLAHQEDFKDFSTYVQAVSKHILIPQTGNDGFDLTLKAPITTAADGKFCDIFPNFRQK